LCNLWESENTDEVLAKAKEEAERKWSETEQRELSGAEAAYLRTGVSSRRTTKGIDLALRQGRWPTLAEVCDFVLETALV
jgi:hypothetical protein